MCACVCVYVCVIIVMDMIFEKIVRNKIRKLEVGVKIVLFPV